MKNSPPPLFRQGASSHAKVIFFSLLALTLLIVDARLHTLSLIRTSIETALYPFQRFLLVPRNAFLQTSLYFTDISTLQRENAALKKQHLLNAQILQQAQQLATENVHLRSLLNSSKQLTVPSLMSEILYDARDVFTRKLILNRGTQQGVSVGQPVIDNLGVVGQITQTYPFTSEVTLLTDKNQAIPIQIVRNGLRSVAYGHSQSGSLELRFISANADIQKGDILATSGIDGIYPAGLLVAKITTIEKTPADAFARVICQPLAGIEHNRQVLILLTNPAATLPALQKENKHAADKENPASLKPAYKKSLVH